MDPAAVELVVLDPAGDDPGLVERAYDAVLAPSFGPDELVPRDRYVDDVSAAAVIVALHGDDVVGAGVSEASPDGTVGLLSHLATHPDCRGTGVGGRMLATLQARWSDGPAVVLGEVHDPRRWPEGPGEQPTARLRFYERCGARLLGVPWVQPPLWEGGGSVPGMLLLVMGGRDADAPVPARWIREWMTAYYESGGAGPDDPTLVALLTRVAAADEVAVLAISDLDAVVPLAP